MGQSLPKEERFCPFFSLTKIFREEANKNNKLAVCQLERATVVNNNEKKIRFYVGWPFIGIALFMQ